MTKFFTKRINVVFLVLLCFFCRATLLSQSLTHAENDFLSPIPKNGEFNLSLGSQIFTDPKIRDYAEGLDMPSIEPMDLNLNIADRFKSENSLPITNFENKPLKTDTGKYFTSMLTLNTGFLGVEDDEIPAFAISNDNNDNKKWSLKSKIETERLIKFKPQIQDANTVNTIKASRLPVGKLSENTTEDSALNSKYFFEATYNFGEKLVGKLSYDASVIDRFKTNEKIELSGTMKANQNILIKAGYGNEMKPEVKNSGKKLDTTVWTEFIMKF